jgi:carbon storage regulator
MLVLTRKLGEQLMIGDGIVVKVIRIDANTVRLGVEAPKDVPILREEKKPKEGNE